MTAHPPCPPADGALQPCPLTLNNRLFDLWRMNRLIIVFNTSYPYSPTVCGVQQVIDVLTAVTVHHESSGGSSAGKCAEVNPRYLFILTSDIYRTPAVKEYLPSCAFMDTVPMQEVIVESMWNLVKQKQFFKSIKLTTKKKKKKKSHTIHGSCKSSLRP